MAPWHDHFHIPDIQKQQKTMLLTEGLRKIVHHRVWIAIVSLIVLPLFSNHLYAQDADEAERARQKLEAQQKALETVKVKKQGLTKQVSQLAQERARLNGSLIKMGKTIRASETALNKVEAKLNKLEGREKKIRASLQQRHGLMSQTLGLLQRMGREPPPIIATHRDDALKMIRSAMLMSKILPDLNQQASGLKKELGALIAVKSSIQDQRTVLREAAASLTADQEKLETIVTQKNLSILAYQKELTEAETLAKTHANSVNNLEGLIAKLDQKLREKTTLGVYEKQLVLNEQDASKRLGKNAVELSAKEHKIAMANPGRIKPAFNFAQAKGALSLPVVGKIIRKFGDKTEIGAKSKGISIESRVSAQITSPCDGWIVYAGPFRSYGQLMIINAGGGYHIIIAGLDRIYVKPAQFVLAGEPLGKAVSQMKTASDRKRPQPRIYVEFRLNGKSIDPAPWWIVTEKAEG